MEFTGGDGAPPRNSPLAIASVLLLVLLVVAAVVLVPKLTRSADGSPVAGGQARESGRDAGQDSGGAPVLPPEASPLLAPGVHLTPVTCALPGLKRTAEALLAFYQSGIGCLDTAWQGALGQAKRPFTKAGVQLSEPQASGCGVAPSKNEATAYYCSGDRAIYMLRDRVLEAADVIPAAHLAVLAHEYGHHVQELSGIMTAVELKMSSADESTPADKELSRRVELQANCFAGLFAAAASGRGDVTKAVADKAVSEFGNTGDSDSHGTRKHQLWWARAGLGAADTSACNTFTAPAADVS
ncbi:neutral zinc metallopeptidase [Amycolatopsis minnesotensis]|uniref:Neutral zinc metallopeptidase n=1 Tax=Amycolatopsis minnesotensis TaxID=337894 RepID=A0ABN2R916_9PSEU